ncbi:MAG: DNA repair protein RecN [Pseudomonadota bacterium]
MLSALSISNFILIDRLDVEAGSGFTGLTGETGAGKSILLDALGLIAGARPEKRFVRKGAKRAVVIAEFEPSPDHAVWQELEDVGLFCDPNEALVIKRVVPAVGSAKSYVNGQPVSGALLSALSEQLLEIHGQHSAGHLMKPSRHLDVLDRFAGNDVLLQRHTQAWNRYRLAKEKRISIEAEMNAAQERRDDLARDAGDLRALCPLEGETKRLSSKRQQLSQVGKLRDGINDVSDAMARTEPGEFVGLAVGTLQRLARLPGFEPSETSTGTGQLLHIAAAAFDRAAIEMDEARTALGNLAMSIEGNDDELEDVEGRLFALRAAARKHNVDPDALPDLLQTMEQTIAIAEAGTARLNQVRQEEADAAAQWRAEADTLSRSRRVAARRLEKAVKRELAPLKLEKVKLRFSFQDLDESQADRRGLDAVQIEVETNPGSGFGRLDKIASGGELARVSLALKCATAEALESSSVLIFDEADQGVGGAVAAAIGQRFQDLATRHQVLAVTHSPQVAAAAAAHWRIEKSSPNKSLGQMRASVLDPGERTEEIARMLSGAKVTKEARAAAQRLLEG